MRNGPIGQYLVQKGLITEEQLQDVLQKQKEQKGRLFGDVIVDLKYVSDVQFAQVLAERLNVPFVDLDAAELIPDVVKRIPEATARKYTVVAVNKVGKRLTVATNDPINFYIFEDLRVITGCSIVPVLSTKAAINRSIGNKWFRTKVSTKLSDKTGYIDSEYPVATALVKKYENDTKPYWCKQDIEKATDVASDRIVKFIFNT